MNKFVVDFSTKVIIFKQMMSTNRFEEESKWDEVYDKKWSTKIGMLDAWESSVEEMIFKS